MKKITMDINGVAGEDGAKKISSALNGLSGIVAADVVLAENKAFAYCGDQLERYSVSSAVRDAGFDCHVVCEEYLSGVEDYKTSIARRHSAD